jgi:hypothetical protein
VLAVPRKIGKRIGGVGGMDTKRQSKGKEVSPQIRYYITSEKTRKPDISIH